LTLSEALGKEIKLREWDVCDAEGNVKKAIFLSSEMYAP
jgi:hypothetical protein